ncbi:hypothetical protein Acsp03_34840 [Actinomadura sp. NBRC 104412]|nr:hypothetical protein Acsp03_34840 [Actinomadura sp. NBRC 104412]
MSVSEWRRGPIGPEADRWATRRTCKSVLVVVHTVTSGQRLLDAVGVLENDLRIQVYFTQAPDEFGSGVPEFLSGLGAARMPWDQATSTTFDLAIAASHGGVHRVRAPLIVMPHGAGHGKLVSRRAGRAAGARLVYGLDAQRLVHDGALVPAALVLAHRDDRRELARSCPEALAVASVVGDPCHDRLRASLDRRPLYKMALGVGDGRKLVVVASTWGPRSLLGSRPDLWPRLLSELPEEEFQVVTLLHPNAWHGHGEFQVRSWLADCLRRGLSLVPPEADWRAVLAAADWVIGDHGSVTTYAAVTGAPVLLGGFPGSEVNPDSAQALLGAVAPRVSGRGSLRRQLLRAADGFTPERYRAVVERITSEPGRFDRNLQRLIYRLLRLRRPAAVPGPRPVPPPFLVSRAGGGR